MTLTTPIEPRGFGNSGDTSLSTLNRANDLFLYDTPTCAVIYIGVNDPGGSIAQATTQLNIEAAIMALKHGAKGDGLDSGCFVSGQASLPATGAFGQRMVVLTDTSTTGGAAKWHPSQAANIGGSVTGPTVWEFREPLAGELGWGRVARPSTTPTVVKRIVVVSANYLNWTTGGDTTTTDYSTYATVRAAQAAAVAAENVAVGGKATVILADLHAFQKARIVAGTDPDFHSVAYVQATSWHVADTNQHHSTYGHNLVAQCVYLAMQSANWLTDPDSLALVSCVGDSQTDFETSYGVAAYDTWTQVLGRMLNAALGL